MVGEWKCLGNQLVVFVAAHHMVVVKANATNVVILVILLVNVGLDFPSIHGGGHQALSVDQTVTGTSEM